MQYNHNITVCWDIQVVHTTQIEQGDTQRESNFVEKIAGKVSIERVEKEEISTFGRGSWRS